MTEAEDSSISVVVNNPCATRTVSVEVELDALAVNTLLQWHNVNDLEGTAGVIAFDTMPQASLEEMLGGQGQHGAELRNTKELLLLCVGVIKMFSILV
jgi:DNA polymerase epsilon subunit 1